MFALRIIDEIRENENSPFQQAQENHWLGKSYAKLEQGITTEFDEEVEKLKDQLKENWPEINVKNDVKSLIIGESGESFFVMKNTQLETHSYFIMTESGQTFEKL